jgi:hypothetical protein
MHQALQAILAILGVGGAMTLFAAAALWWFEPSRRITRALAQMLGEQPDVVAAAPARGQGAAMVVDSQRIGVLRDLKDPGLVFGFDEWIGAELIFDGRVAARAFRGEPRRALDHISPEVGRVMLRLVFDDVRDPEFELDLWSATDRPGGHDADSALQTARRWFARAEVVLRR